MTFSIRLLAVSMFILSAVACATVSAADDEQGFVALFDGKSLDGWQGAINGYEVSNGVLACKKKGGGHLFTKGQYSDFVLRFEFKLEAGGNNGIGIRSPLSGNPAYAAMELQVLDDSAPQYKNLAPYQYHGSIYGVVAAKRGHQKKVGEWNVQEITCKGHQITVRLNGVTIVDADIKKASTPKTLDGRNHPGLLREKGHIGLLGHGSHVEFRNLRVKELK